MASDKIKMMNADHIVVLLGCAHRLVQNSGGIVQPAHAPGYLG